MKKEKILILLFMTIGWISFGLSMPVLNEQIVLAFGSKGLAIEKLVGLISITITCAAYKFARAREVIKRTFLGVFLVSVTIATVIVMIIINKFNPILFLVCHLVCYCVLVQYVIRALIGLRAWFFAEPERREDYDNSKNLWTAVGGLVGFGISSFIVIPLNIALILYIVSMFDIFGWILIYIKHKKEYTRNIPLKINKS